MKRLLIGSSCFARCLLSPPSPARSSTAPPGKPQAGATVTLLQMGQAGLEPVDRSEGRRAGQIHHRPDRAQGPHSCCAAIIDGVTYNHMLPPGQPANGITLDVYNASKHPGDAKVSKHMILFQPHGQADGGERDLHRRQRRQDRLERSRHGTLHFYLPAAAKDKRGERHARPTACRSAPTREDQSGRTSTRSISPSSPARRAST